MVIQKSGLVFCNPALRQTLDIYFKHPRSLRAGDEKESTVTQATVSADLQPNEVDQRQLQSNEC